MTTAMTAPDFPGHVTHAVMPSCIAAGVGSACWDGVDVGLATGEDWATGRTPWPQAITASPANRRTALRVQPMLLR